MADLIERLQHAACKAIAEQRPDLERRPEQVRSLLLEIELKRDRGSVSIVEATSYLQRRVSTAAILGTKG